MFMCLSFRQVGVPTQATSPFPVFLAFHHIESSYLRMSSPTYVLPVRFGTGILSLTEVLEAPTYHTHTDSLSCLTWAIVPSISAACLLLASEYLGASCSTRADSSVVRACSCRGGRGGGDKEGGDGKGGVACGSCVQTGAGRR